MEITIPIDTLKRRDYSNEDMAPAAAGDGAQPPERKFILPQKGDPVDFSIKGSVVAISGSMATVKVAFIDGKRPTGPETEEEDLEEAAKAADAGTEKPKAEKGEESAG